MHTESLVCCGSPEQVGAMGLDRVGSTDCCGRPDFLEKLHGILTEMAYNR